MFKLIIKIKNLEAFLKGREKHIYKVTFVLWNLIESKRDGKIESSMLKLDRCSRQAHLSL